MVVGKQAATKHNSWISSLFIYFWSNFPSLQISHLFKLPISSSQEQKELSIRQTLFKAHRCHHHLDGPLKLTRQDVEDRSGRRIYQDLQGSSGDCCNASTTHLDRLCIGSSAVKHLEVLVASFRGVYKGCELHLILLNLIVFFFFFPFVILLFCNTICLLHSYDKCKVIYYLSSVLQYNPLLTLYGIMNAVPVILLVL